MTRPGGIRRSRTAVAAAFMLLTSGAVAVAPNAGAATKPGPKVSYSRVVESGLGFDVCDAPPTSTMRAWLASSYRAVNIYFAGHQRLCSTQSQLTADWVRTVTANGWSIIPTYVGLQAPCYGGSKKKMSTNATTAQAQGRAAADDAIDFPPTGLTALGFHRGTPAYVDIEPYNVPAGNTSCDRSVRRFVRGWIERLRARGYRAGVYSTPTSGIRAIVAGHRVSSSYPVPDDIWFARYDNVVTTRSADIPSTYLPNHRIKQYCCPLNPDKTGYTESHAGLTLNIDKDAMGGDVEHASSVTTPSATATGVGGAPAYTYAVSGAPASGLNVRTSPSTSGTSLRTLANGTTIQIECQTVGDTVHGDYVWDKLATPDDEYVHDLYTNTTGGNGVSPAIKHCETAPPTLTVTPLPTTTLRSSVTVSYTASDDSGVASYDVRYRKATDRGGFGHWQYPSAWQRTSAKTETLTGLTPGGTYCLSVRARDRLTNVTRWSRDTCVARPLDDRALTVGTSWHRQTGNVFYLHTVTSTKTAGVRLSRTNEQLLRVGIVATRCPTCGKVRILVGGTSVGVIDLSNPTTLRRRTLLLDPFATLRTGTVTIRVMSSGKQVAIDGLVVSRR